MATTRKVLTLSGLTKYDTKIKAYIAALLAGKISKTVVSDLPALEDAQENVIYLVPRTTTAQSNIKDEYILVIEGTGSSATRKWEAIGTTEIELDGYATETYASNAATTALTSAKSYADGKFLTGVTYNSTSKKLQKTINGSTTDIVSGATLVGNEVTDGAPTLSWGNQATVATIGGQAIHVTMPSNPNTDTKVTTVGNHYTPSGGSAKTTTQGTPAAATAGTSYDVVTGVTVTVDAAGHVTGISTTRQKIVSDSHQSISGKADKVTPATPHNIATLDDNGNLEDGGITISGLKGFATQAASDAAGDVIAVLEHITYSNKKFQKAVGANTPSDIVSAATIVADGNGVPNTRKVNGKALSSDITLASTDLSDTSDLIRESDIVAITDAEINALFT